jgi:hypothetical protein
MQNSTDTLDAIPTTETAAPGVYLPPSIMPLDADDELPGLVLEYRPPPIHCLPPPLSEYVSKCAEAIGCDPSLVAMPMLAAVAAAIGDSRAVFLKHGWIEFPVLWTLAIAPSGAMKTPAMKAAMEGVETAQKEAFNAFQSAEAAHKSALADWQKKKNPATAEPIAPKLTSYYIGDATIQAVCLRLRDNPRGLLQKRDELSGWLGSFDQYSDGNEAAQWLEFHSANSLKIDRADENKPTIYVPRALVPVTGTIQQPVLKKLLTGDGAQHFDNGLAARFLMSMPPERERKWREAVTPPEIVRQYVSLFKDLFALAPQVDAETGNRTPQLLTLSPAAKSLFVEFVNRHGRELRAFKDDRLKSAWSKLEAQAARLALIFHIVREVYLPSPGEDAARTISADTMQAALEWVDWFKNETRRIYFTLTHEGTIRQADKLFKFTRRSGGRCTAAQAAKYGAGGNTAAEVEGVMKSLVAAGLAEWQEPEQPKGGFPTRYFCTKTAAPVAGKVETARETRETH